MNINRNMSSISWQNIRQKYRLVKNLQSKQKGHYGQPGARHLSFRNVVDVFIHFEINTLSALTAIYSTCTIDKRLFAYCALYSTNFPSVSKNWKQILTLNCFKIASSSVVVYGQRITHLRHHSRALFLFLFPSFLCYFIVRITTEMFLHT